jgi:hypothetical protein
VSEIDTSTEEFKAAVKAALDEEAAGLKKALDSERDARKAAEKAAAKFKDVDLDKYSDLITKAEKAEEDRQREAGKFDELLDKERQKFKGTVEERDTRIATLTASLERTLIESAAKSAITQHGGDEELLLPHVTKATKLLEIEGRHVAVVVDEKGEPRLAPEAKNATDYMGIDHLVGGWKESGKYAGAFAGTGASGGGAPPRNQGGGPPGPKKTVSESDFMSNLDGIAKGEVKVAV